MENEPGLLEKEAHALLAQGKVEGAYTLFKKPGDIYKEKGRHKEAALSLVSAEKIFHNASLSYQEAARESELAGDLEYASLLYRQAAINFERDMEFLSFSECFYYSRECLRRFLTRDLLAPKKNHPISASTLTAKGAEGIIKKLLLWFSLTISSLIWGHGERPNRTFCFAIVLVFLSSFCYMVGNLAQGTLVFRPNFFQAFYFSVTTFSTVGYGDMTPVGLSRFIAMLEVFGGIFIIPLFIVGLSRKYLRI